ncbi:MAG TPA: permease-like cell division protein FtsX [Gaiellaceae bacterium]|nr:permease-like cell division protein FtsX [Gaiellaceae bacterium]
MNRLRMVLAESLRSLTANLSTTVAATMTVLIGMFLLGLFIALGTWVLSWSDHAKEKLRIKVYMCTVATCPQAGEATPQQINRVRIRLLDTQGVKDVRFVSKEDALTIMEKRNPDLVEGLTSNPLPNSFEVTPARAEDVKAVSASIRQASLPGVEKVRDGEKVADRIIQVATAISTFFLVAVVVLVVASTLLIANTIRLSIFSRRREIEVMKLVGATNWFVRGPFMIEGLICGVFGSVAAIVLLLLGKELVVPAILGRVEAGSEVSAVAFAWNALALLAVGLLLGAVGSGLTLRRFLRV